MSGQQKNEAETETHRLIDMVVEEVSLVDRAANKHRFLVVKRDVPMADKNNRKTKPKPKSPAPEEQEAEKMSKALDEALGIATTALETLTSAIEQLGEAAGEESGPIVADLAEELSEVAQQLAAAAGVEKAAAEPAESSGEVPSVVQGVRSMLSQVSEILSSSAGNNEPGQPQPASQTSAVSGELAEVGKQLSTIASSLKSLNDAFKEQSQRVGRLEKGVGLPNSRQAQERSEGRVEADDVTWPMDLNRPMDRQSVDKNLSFHDGGKDSQ